MTDVLVKPAFVSAIADSGEAAKLGPTAWNAARLFSAGTTGDILTRDTASATGASWSSTLANLTVTNPIAGSVTGSATVLQTPRAINGVNFDGSAAITVAAAAGTLTGATLAAGVLASSLTSVGILAALAVSAAAPLFTRDALAAVATDGLVLQNTTASTAGVPVQIAPRLRFRAHVWNTTTPTDNTQDWNIDVLPVSAAVPTGALRFSSSLNGAGAVVALSLDNVGNAGLGGLMTVAGVSSSSTVSATAFRVTSKFAFVAPADGQLGFSNTAITSGVGVDVNTNGVLKVRTTAQTGYATVDALGYSVSGVAGVTTFGPAAVASITVKGGIITAIS